MPTPTHDIHAEYIDDQAPCNDSTVWPVVIAAGSVLLGYFVGRISYRRELQAAVRQIEDSPEPIEISIRTL